MYLLIDGQALQVPTTRNRGVGRYSCNLVNALVKARPDWRIELVESTHMEPIDRDRVPGVATRAFRPLLPFAGASLDANERYFGDWLTAQAPDAILELSFFESPTLGLAPLFTGTRPRLFGILYDLIPLLFPRQYLNHGSWEYARRFRQLLSADGVLAISQAAADDLRAALPCLGLEIVNISGAPDPLLLPHAAEELEQFRETLRLRFGVEKPFLLSVVATDFRKNIEGILRGFAALPTSVRSQMELVIVCPLDDAQRSALEEKGRKLGLADSLRLPGFVNDNALSALYQLCRVFFFPSLYEGLGLPVLEALRCGAPVVTSNCSSLPEVAGPACWLADPNSPEDLARALLEALAEPRELRLAARLAHADTFHWPKTAESAARALEARPVFRPRRR